jgi:hypothetical protein
MTVAKHPDYAKFFKLLKLGASLPQLKQRMVIEGLDPALIE